MRATIFARTLRPLFVPAALLAAALLLGACGDADGSDPLLGDEGGGALQVHRAWVRPAFEGMNTAVYFQVAAGAQDDRLLGASYEGAGQTMLHETLTEGDLVRMEELGSLPLEAGGSLDFEPGGKHLMLVDLAGPLEEGDTIVFTLDFETAGPVEVEAEVRRDG